MRLDLIPHPDTPAKAIARVSVEIGPVSGQQVRLRYEVGGDIDQLAVTAPADPERTDGLWQRTCFEAFVRMAGAVGYDEFNFSPSTQWAAYRFDGHRTGMRKPDVLAPRVEGGVEDEDYVLHAAFDLPSDGPWHLALTAVIEELDGTKSYWALKHPAGKPDFHHADGFVLELT